METPSYTIELTENIRTGLPHPGRQAYERVALCEPDFVFKHRTKFENSQKQKMLVNGYLTTAASQRYEVFANSLTCVNCGVTGSYFALERDIGTARAGGPFYFNLYAITKDGYEILMTKDHIVPKAQGGNNHISNMQTMCKVCNEKKGRTTESELKVQGSGMRVS